MVSKLLNEWNDLSFHSSEYDVVSLGNWFPTFETTVFSQNVRNQLPSSASQENGNASYFALKTREHVQMHGFHKTLYGHYDISTLPSDFPQSG